MPRVAGHRRSLMERAADSHKIVRVILKSLDYEPVSVQRLSEEFGVDRASIRKDISLWLENFGHENQDITSAVLNWRDSHVAPQAVRDQYVDLALDLMNERKLDLKACAEVFGVDTQALGYWMKRAGKSVPSGTHTREHQRFASASGDLDLHQQLEELRSQVIKDTRESIKDQLAAAETL